MKRPELVAKVARETGVSKRVAQKAVDAFAKAVMTDAKNNGKVNLAGLGSLSVTSLAPTTSAASAAISLVPSKYLLSRAFQLGLASEGRHGLAAAALAKGMPLTGAARAKARGTLKTRARAKKSASR